MNEQKDTKLKRLINQVPPGFLIDAKWLVKNGYSRTSQHDYVRSNWLERLAHGVYRRPDPQAFTLQNIPDWQRVVLSMQWLMEYRVHVGGRSALALAGLAHYLELGDSKQNVFVYGADFPGWLARIESNATFICRKTKLFRYTARNLVEDETLIKRPLSEKATGDFEIYCSTIERAILEAIDELPNLESFHQIDTAFESLANLSPRRMMKLLHDCKSVKVKRLFFVFADRHNHAWRKHLDHREINLGSGDRSFIKNGRLHPVYRITVPSEYVSKEGVDHGA